MVDMHWRSTFGAGHCKTAPIYIEQINPNNQKNVLSVWSTSTVPLTRKSNFWGKKLQNCSLIMCLPMTETIKSWNHVKWMANQPKMETNILLAYYCWVNSQYPCDLCPHLSSCLVQHCRQASSGWGCSLTVTLLTVALWTTTQPLYVEIAGYRWSVIDEGNSWINLHDRYVVYSCLCLYMSNCTMLNPIHGSNRNKGTTDWIRTNLSSLKLYNKWWNKDYEGINLNSLFWLF